MFAQLIGLLIGIGSAYLSTQVSNGNAPVWQPVVAACAAIAFHSIFTRQPTVYYAVTGTITFLVAIFLGVMFPDFMNLHATDLSTLVYESLTHNVGYVMVISSCVMVVMMFGCRNNPKFK